MIFRVLSNIILGNGLSRNICFIFSLAVRYFQTCASHLYPFSQWLNKCNQSAVSHVMVSYYYHQVFLVHGFSYFSAMPSFFTQLTFIIRIAFLPSLPFCVIERIPYTLSFHLSLMVTSLQHTDGYKRRKFFIKNIAKFAIYLFSNSVFCFISQI